MSAETAPQFPDSPRILLLVGLPGSGKSTFANSLAKSGWHVISSDQLRKEKGAFDNLIGIATKLSALLERKVVVDKCSVSKNQRAYLLQVMHSPHPRDIHVVFFDKPREDCEANISLRKDHPTIENGRSSQHYCHIIDGFVENFVAPTQSEGFGNVHTVRSHDDSDVVLKRFGAASVWVEHPTLIKFPRTRHLLDAGGGAVSRDDLVMSPEDAEQWIAGATIIVEEKIDGANLGISITSQYEVLFQNRSHFVNSETASQWRGLDVWYQQHSQMLNQVLEPEKHILYGEWMAAKHSIHYTELPGYFIAFDVYDKSYGRFLSRGALNELLEPTGIPMVRKIDERKVNSPTDLKEYLESISGYGARRDSHPETNAPVEGVYLRVDDGPWLQRRCKIVRADFTGGIEAHWSSKTMVKNRLKY